MREPSFDRRLDEVGREEGKRDRHVDLADAAAVRRQLCKRRRRASLSLPPPSLTRWRQRLGEEQPAVQVR
jgi:hypothetical protein